MSVTLLAHRRAPQCGVLARLAFSAKHHAMFATNNCKLRSLHGASPMVALLHRLLIENADSNSWTALVENNVFLPLVVPIQPAVSDPPMAVCRL